MSKKYITTAIPYVNARPHIGHAMDYLLADIWARYQKQQGHEVRFSAGLDEHGTKVAQKAAENNVKPQAFVDDLAPHFQAMIKRIGAGVTDSVRTSDPEHMQRVQEIWRKLNTAGMIYKSTYEGWYCVGCEGFVTESEARAMNFTCPDHQKPLEKLSEDNYYLKVSKYTDEIRNFIKSSVVPEFRGRELLELIKDGAQDVSISRPKEKLAWGVPVPDDDTQVMYVWIDALSNYITALGYPDENWSADFWPADVEVIGKDILRFHAIIWPAMLLGLGLELPKTLLAHGFVNAGGAKLSKSTGNVIDPLAIMDEYGVDAFRYFFVRHIPTFDDGDFTWEKFEAAYNGELANDLGNLVSRTANMLKKYEIRRDDDLIGQNAELLQKLNDESVTNFHANMEKLEFSHAVDSVWEIIQTANKFIDENKPWALAKTNRQELEKVMNLLWSQLGLVRSLLMEIIPETSNKIAEIFLNDAFEIPDEIPILFPKKYLHTEEPARK